MGAKSRTFKHSAFERATSLHEFVEHVKWAKEVINTCPDNFELDKLEDDGGAIYIKTAGIYEVNACFFLIDGEAKPSIQVKVNGKPMLSTIDKH